MNHGTKKNKLIREQDNTSSPIFIGEEVWIATHVSIIKGSKIENGAIIGANSLVNSFIENYSICVGTPAKKIKNRK